MLQGRCHRPFDGVNAKAVPEFVGEEGATLN